MDEDQEAAGRAAIEANVRLALDELGPLVEGGLRLDRDGVAWVEGYLERTRARADIPPDGGLAAVVASFVGECLVRAADARWALVDGRWAVVFANGDQAFPFDKVAKAVEHGLEGGESLLSFHDVALDLVATGRLRRPD